jgi:hypothetical protein
LDPGQSGQQAPDRGPLLIVSGRRAAPRPGTIVLEHGAFADASGWNGVTHRLQERGYTVYAPANPAAYFRQVFAADVVIDAYGDLAATTLWSRVHGLVSLEIEGNFASMDLDPATLYDAEVCRHRRLPHGRERLRG